MAWFGTADKPLLLGGLALVIVLVAAGCGLLARRRPLARRDARRGLGLVAAAPP